MPTENEKKYVLKSECEDEIKKIADAKLKIQQGYLVASKGISLRVRKSHYTGQNPKFFLTFKSAANSRVIEIEKKIDERDFNDLWEQALNKLEKVRYLVNASGILESLIEGWRNWEIDFFKDFNDETYFALAEFEMPEGQKEPELIPDFIQRNLIYEVDLTDSRFSSKLLADVRYAKNILLKLGSNK